MLVAVLRYVPIMSAMPAAALSSPLWLCVLLAGAAAAGKTAAPLLPAKAADDWLVEVQAGDTLTGIARAWMAPPHGWRALQRFNRVNEPRRLQPGTRLRVPQAWLLAQPAAAELQQLVGDVSVLAGGGTSAAPATAGMALHAGDTVQVAAGASALLRLGDGSLLLLTPGSRLTLQQLLLQRGGGAGISTLQLHEGTAESRVRREAPRPRYEIRTPVLTLGVRGTEFRARFDPASQRAWGEVASGRVAALGSAASAASAVPSGASGARETLVDAGFGVVATQAAVSAPAALPAAPDLSPLPARLERLPLRLPWAAAAPAQGQTQTQQQTQGQAQPGNWRAQIFEAGAAGRLLLDGRFGEPLAEFADLPDGDYLLRVRAIDATGLEGRDAQAAFTLKARPEPPFLREPAAAAVLTGSSARFTWTQSRAAARYRLQIAADAGFAPVLQQRDDIAATDAELPLPPGAWFWRVASVRDNGDAGPWSDAQPFTLQPVPPTPPPPVHGTPSVEAGRLTLRWSAGPPAAGYEVQVARDAAFTDIVASQRTTAPEVVLDAPPGGHYHVRTRRIAAGGAPGLWGTPGEFDVPGWRWWWFTPVLLLFLL